ncbi:MAG TPA: type II secretion system F family protein, partial [Candidatus Thermoplasmatota archaeon]|nr:type II secretion system F family protein [Candidatus Thermoplasmatota archaeon]
RAPPIRTPPAQAPPARPAPPRLGPARTPPTAVPHQPTAPSSPADRSAELSVILLLTSATLMTVGGAVLALAASGGPAEVGLQTAMAGILLSGLAVVLGVRVPVLRTLMPPTSEGARYEATRKWNRLRFVGLFLYALAVACGVVLVFIFGVRGGVLTAQASSSVLDRGALVLTAALSLTQAAAYAQTLVTPLERPRDSLRSLLALLALILQGLLVLLAFLVQAKEDALTGVGLGPDDAAALLLAAAIVASFSLSLFRLPALATLLSLERGAGQVVPSSVRGRHLMTPILGAFALLLLVFLLFILFGVGALGLFKEVGRSPIVLGTLIFLVVALGLSAAAAFSVARTEMAEPMLFKPLVDRRQRGENLLLAGSAGGALLLAVPAILAFPGSQVLDLPGRTWLHLFCLAVLVALGPYGYHKSFQYRRIRRMEERFPDFLRDLASSHRGGLTLTAAVQVASRGEYGPLTPEVQKMADQLRWNVPFAEALERFAERVRTPLARRAVSLILQANKSGGSTTDVLLAAARDAREIKNLENERRLTMSLYTLVIYITFFVFLTVVAVLYNQFVPQIVGSSEAVQAGGALGQVGGLGGTSVTVEQFQLFYFLAALVQAIGDGVVAGLMGSGKAVLGLRHAFLMVLITYVTFAFLL